MCGSAERIVIRPHYYDDDEMMRERARKEGIEQGEELHLRKKVLTWKGQERQVNALVEV